MDVLRARLTMHEAALTNAHAELTESRERGQSCAACAMLREALAQVMVDSVIVFIMGDIFPHRQGAEDQRRLRGKLQAARAALMLAKQQLEQQRGGPSNSVLSGSPVQAWGHRLVHAAAESAAVLDARLGDMQRQLQDGVDTTSSVY